MSGIYLKQSTASQSRALGPYIDDTDFKTAETGLTIANTDIKLVINGAASVNKNSGGGTHRVNGVYGVTFDATDTATVGEVEVSCKVAGALPVFKTFYVLEEAVYDAMFAASAPGYLQPTVATRKLDITSTGAAGIDLGNVENQTATLGLTNTTVGVVSTIAGTIGTLDELDTAQDLEHGITQLSINALAASPGVGATPFIPTAITVTAGAGGSGVPGDLANVDTNQYTVNDAAGTITLDLDYELGSGIAAVQFILVAAAQGNTDDLTFQIFDQVGLAYDTFDTLTGANGLIYASFDVVTIAKYTTNAGLFQVRITGTGLSSATLTIDKAVCYGQANKGGITNGSTITLAAATNNQNLEGHNWILDLSGEDIGGSFFAGSKDVFGIGVCANGQGYKFKDCTMLMPTLTSEGQINDCRTTGMTFTSSALGVADHVSLSRIDSRVAGSSVPPYDWSAITKTTSISAHGIFGGGDWTFSSFCTASIEVFDGGKHTIVTGGGDVEFRGNARELSIVLTGGDTVQIRASAGPIAISGVGTGSTVNIYGEHSTLTNTASGSPTVTDDAILTNNAATATALAVAQDDLDTITDTDGVFLGAAGVDLILEEAFASHLTPGTIGLAIAIAAGIIIDTTVTGTPTSTEITFSGGSTVANFYAEKKAYILAGTAGGQSVPILSSSYFGGTTTLLFDEAWSVVADAGDRLIINIAHIHPITEIQDGLATDTQATDIQGRLPAALSPNGNMDANVLEINDSTTAGAAFNRAVKSNVIGTVGTGSTTTSIVTTSITPTGTATDQFVPRYLVFADDTTTAALRGQATDITANTAAANPTFTVTALTSSPVSGDTFVIL